MEDLDLSSIILCNVTSLSYSIVDALAVTSSREVAHFYSRSARQCHTDSFNRFLLLLLPLADRFHKHSFGLGNRLFPPLDEQFQTWGGLTVSNKSIRQDDRIGCSGPFRLRRSHQSSTQSVEIDHTRSGTGH